MDLWSRLFKVVELTTIARQQEHFAQPLNRARTCSEGTPMLDCDIQTLKHCETDEVSSAFATNAQVNGHNLEQLFSICDDYAVTEAEDFINCKTTGKLRLTDGHHISQEQPLKDTRVMLGKNVDVADGLVNGVCSTVTEIVYSCESFLRWSTSSLTMLLAWSKGNTVHILLLIKWVPLVSNQKVTRKGGLRRQFPLKLALYINYTA